jgi:hypothetical protein
MFLAGRGVGIKASLVVGERFGERSVCTTSNREGLYNDFQLRRLHALGHDNTRAPTKTVENYYIFDL